MCHMSTTVVFIPTTGSTIYCFSGKPNYLWLKCNLQWSNKIATKKICTKNWEWCKQMEVLNEQTHDKNGRAKMLQRKKANWKIARNARQWVRNDRSRKMWRWKWVRGRCKWIDLPDDDDFVSNGAINTVANLWVHVCVAHGHCGA